MSKIFGILNFRENEISDENLRSNLQTNFDQTEEKLSGWTEKNIGLFQIDLNAEENPLTQNSFQIKEGNNFGIVADVNLTNHLEIFDKLGILPSEQNKFSDKQLILEAYRKWGENCPEYLAGDFAFAIWDEPKRKLFCARDHFGSSTLFYYKDSEKFIFGSQPKWILSFEGVEKKFNLRKLGIFLLPEPHTFTAEQSWFENIHPFPAGTSLTIDKNLVNEKRYWKPELGKTLPYKSEEEILEAFREILFEVIEARLRNNPFPVSLLSGGLDSSSIVSVAAKILEKQNREINALAGVVADDKKEKFADERFFIDQFKSFPNVRINHVTVPEVGPFSDLEKFFEHYDNPYLTSRYYLYTTFSRKAYKIGATTLFDGALGEMGPTAHGWGGFAEMFVRFRWLKLWRELKLRKELYNDSIRYNVRANTINPLLPQFLINLRQHGKFQEEHQLNEYHPLQKNIAGKLSAEIDFKKHTRGRILPDHAKNQLNDLKFLQKKMSENVPINYIVEPVEVRCPLLDKRLIEFTLGVPLSLKFKDGYYRYLIRAALDNILPPEIQWRTSKKPFSPDYLRRYNSQIGEVRELLAAIKPNDPLREFLDIEKIKSWADLEIPETERYTVKEQIARDHLPVAIYLIYFLRKFSEFRL